MSDFESMVQSEVERRLKNPEYLRSQIISLSDKIKMLAPKAEFFDAVSASPGSMSMAEVAQIIGKKDYGQNNLFKFLLSKNIITKYKNNRGKTQHRPYQQYIHLFKINEEPYVVNGVTCLNCKLEVNQKGLAYILKLIEKEEEL